MRNSNETEGELPGSRQEGSDEESASPAGSQQEVGNPDKPRKSSRYRFDPRAGLLDLKHELLREMNHCQEEFAAEGVSVSEGDDSTERASQSIRIDMINHISGRLREVERALQRLSEGSYGICVRCGKRIVQTRLKMNPTAERCLECQIGMERKQRRAS